MAKNTKKTSAARVTFDMNNKRVREIVTMATEATFTALNADVNIARLFMEGCRAKAFVPADAKHVMNGISAAIAKRYADRGIKREAKPAAATRISELAGAGKLFDYACADDVFTTLASLDVGMDSIYAVSRAIRDGGDKKITKGPSRAAMVAMINDRRAKKNGKGSAKRKRVRAINLVRATEGLQSSVAAMLKDIGKLDGHEHLARVAKELGTFMVAAKRIMKARAEAKAEA